MANETYKALLETVVTERAKEMGAADQSEAFESVVNTLLLDAYDLSIDEIEAGETDGSGDGQVDAMYVLVNGVSLTDSEEAEFPDKGPLEIDIIIIQAKNTDGFEENPLKIIRSTVADLMDISASYTSYLSNYNDAIQDRFTLARKALLASAGRTARIRVRVCYATKASTKNIHHTVLTTADVLKDNLKTHAATQDVHVEFFGAEELISLSRQPRTQVRSLEVEQHLSSDTGDSFACLVTIDSLMSFLSDESGDLVRAMFDANVRDFLGKTEVNESIRSTLSSIDGEDFWWFNNGITVVASEVDQKGKRLALTDPLLVNGLQTSNVLHAFMSDPNVDEKTRDKCRAKIVLAKIIVPPSEKVRDEIIKATNSQTHIPKPYLRGMDVVHRNIEDHLKAVGLFYERRKNQYKNAGKRRSQIVTLTEMAQSLMAALLFRGADARARPNSLLKSDADYQLLFSDAYHLDTFRNIVEAKRSVMDTLSDQYSDRGAAFRNNVVYHVLSYVSERRFHNSAHAAAGWRALSAPVPDLSSDTELITELFIDEGATDRVAKSPDFKTKVSELAKSARAAMLASSAEDAGSA